eukprot:m.490822 g.490822  ORF g.490822 m.490822 type:complete len:342 (-) comp28663_c0_seq1:50-1075(-)
MAETPAETRAKVAIAASGLLVGLWALALPPPARFDVVTGILLPAAASALGATLLQKAHEAVRLYVLLLLVAVGVAVLGVLVVFLVVGKETDTASVLERIVYVEMAEPMPTIILQSLIMCGLLLATHVVVELTRPVFTASVENLAFVFGSVAAPFVAMPLWFAIHDKAGSHHTPVTRTLAGKIIVLLYTAETLCFSAVPLGAIRRFQVECSARWTWQAFMECGALGSLSAVIVFVGHGVMAIAALVSVLPSARVPTWNERGNAFLLFSLCASFWINPSTGIGMALAVSYSEPEPEPKQKKAAVDIDAVERLEPGRVIVAGSRRRTRATPRASTTRSLMSDGE